MSVTASAGKTCPQGACGKSTEEDNYFCAYQIQSYYKTSISKWAPVELDDFPFMFQFLVHSHGIAISHTVIVKW